MAESELTDAQALALAGTTDTNTGFEYHTVGQASYYHDGFRQRQRMLQVVAPLTLRVYKDGALTFGVYAGKFYNGDTLVEYAGASEQALTVSDTNYIYLTAAGALTVNVTGFPVPSVTPHVPLATIVMGATSFDYDDITDCRDRSLWSINGAAAGSLNSLDWQESVADELDFTSAEPASPTLGDRYLNTGTGASSETTQTVAAHDIEQWNGTNWTEITPTEGFCTCIEDVDTLKAFNGSAWVTIGTFALWNEMQTFFGATDISGAEAEILTDGSNADAKHVHTLDSGVSDVTATASEINQALDGISVNVTDTNLNALTGAGETSLHKHPVDDTTIEISGGDLQVKDRGIDTDKLAAAVQAGMFFVDGAVGDGSADDTVAIQAAIDAAEAGTYGGTVLLPTGTFLVDKLTVNSSKVGIRGAGPGTILKSKSGQSVLEFESPAQAALMVGDFGVVGYGSKVASGSAVTATGGSTSTIEVDDADAANFEYGGWAYNASDGTYHLVYNKASVAGTTTMSVTPVASTSFSGLSVTPYYGGHGIVLNTSASGYAFNGCSFGRIQIRDCGGHGFTSLPQSGSIFAGFSISLADITVTLCDEDAFALRGWNIATKLDTCYARIVPAGKWGYRIDGGEPIIIACNGIDSGSAGDCMRFGATAAVDGFANTCRPVLMGCNVEEWEDYGIKYMSGSRGYHVNLVFLNSSGADSKAVELAYCGAHKNRFISCEFNKSSGTHANTHAVHSSYAPSVDDVWATFDDCTGDGVPFVYYSGTSYRMGQPSWYTAPRVSVTSALNSNVISWTIQLLDPDGNDYEEYGKVRFWLSEVTARIPDDSWTEITTVSVTTGEMLSVIDVETTNSQAIDMDIITDNTGTAVIEQTLNDTWEGFGNAQIGAQELERAYRKYTAP